MKRILALLLAVTCTMGTLCACGGATSGSGSAANDETSSFTNDDHDNSITVGIAQDLDESLDPYTITAAGTREVLFNIYEGLFKTGPDGELIPAVAEKYTTSADGLTYTFILRDHLITANGIHIIPIKIGTVINKYGDQIIFPNKLKVFVRKISAPLPTSGIKSNAFCTP